MKTNLLIITFNRPHYLEKVLSNINTSDFKKIFAFIDGPRNNNDRDQIKKIIKLLMANGIVNLNIQKNNLGMNVAVETAISWFFKNVKQGIILEEDCVPEKSFFSFAGAMLKKYKSDERIGMISGTNFCSSNKNSYLFSHHFGVWGWGTWRNRWQKYTKINKKQDIKISFFELLKFTKSLAGALTLRTKFVRLTNKKMVSWDMNWVYTNTVNNWLCIIPSMNLVRNIGYLGNSSNKKTKYHDRETFKMDISKLEHPVVAQNIRYDKLIDRKYNFFPAVKTLIYQAINFKNFS